MRFQMLMPASVSIEVSNYDETILLLHIKTRSIYMHYVTTFSIVEWEHQSESWGDCDLQSQPLPFALDELYGALANLWLVRCGSGWNRCRAQRTGDERESLCGLLRLEVNGGRLNRGQAPLRPWARARMSSASSSPSRYFPMK